MALFKEIRQDDGVVTSYHRILHITVVTNRCNNIAVLSYVDDEVRAEQKEDVISQPYQKAITYCTDYNPNMNISSAYDYLKTLPEFEGATDI